MDDHDPAAWLDFKARLKRSAARLGLAALGVVDARPLLHLQDELQRRRLAGLYPAFCEPDPGRRSDPQAWLPGARSIWVAALPYQPPGPQGQATPALPAAPDRPWGRLAAYAVCPDYHRELGRRLQVLVRWAARHTGRDAVRDFRLFVDTGPPVERELFRLSGMGFIGKNTCAYVPGAGSWVVLGVAVTTLPLPPDPPPQQPDEPPAPTDACAGCTRCIDACPTGALSPYVLDPNRCISQLTQRRGSLDEAERLALGRWLFGCDVCQMVCPYNTPEQAPLAYQAPRRLKPAPGLSARMSLAALLELDGKAFGQRFGPTAAAWRGKNVLQRNAAYAAGRALRAPAGPSGSDRAGDSLAGTLQRLADAHPSPAVREACEWALSLTTRPLRPRTAPWRTRPSGGPYPPDGEIPAR